MSDKFVSPLRYPGGKGKLADFMKLLITRNNLKGGDYVEIYAGGAAIALELLFDGYVQTIHINDINGPLIAFWKSVLEETDALCGLIADTPVTTDEWERQKAVQTNPTNHSSLELGFSTFFLNRTNRSGILTAGCIGGKKQEGNWKIDARFNKSLLLARIQRIAEFADHINIYNQDAAEFIHTELPCLPDLALIYLDPPYFNKGHELYENHYDFDDHAKIAKLVATIRQPWLVSYDSCEAIDSLYSSFRDRRYQIKYSVYNHYDGSEALFFSDNLVVPQVNTPISITRQDYSAPLIPSEHI